MDTWIYLKNFLLITEISSKINSLSVMNSSRIILYGIFSCIAGIIFSCSSDAKDIADTESKDLQYKVIDNTIIRNGKPFIANGVNTLNSFGIANQDLIKPWNITIVREFIGNLREQPISGGAIQDAQGFYLHSLQSIVDANIANNLVTILCPFGWVDNLGKQTLFTGLNPKEQPFYDSYKIKMKAIAKHFKNQPDVWLEVWNEPYHFNNDNGYTHDLWLSDQTDMIDNLRAVEGFNNIIVVPGNEQGQSETVILEKGAALLAHHSNIVFDLHAYEKWLLNNTSATIQSRITLLHTSGFAILFGEIGVINASGLMSVTDFLSVAKRSQTITLAWLFNRNTNDQNALLTDEGAENNTNNNNWGTTFKSFLAN